jgi:magnesium transporter
MSENQTPSSVNEREYESTSEMLEEVAEEGFSLSDERIAAIREEILNDDRETLRALIIELSDADVADLLHKLDEYARHELLGKFGDDIDPYVFLLLDAELRERVLSDMPASQVARIIADLDSDDALEMILDLDEPFQKEILQKLSARTRLAIEEGLSYPEDSAGRLMQREYVAIPQFWTVGKTIDYLRAAADELPDDFYDLIVIDPSYHVVGAIPLNRLIRAKRSEKIAELSHSYNYMIPATMDQEEAAHLFRREGLGSAPVVDEDGRLVGVITIDDVIDVIDEEAEEDILKMAGVKEGDLYRAVLETSLTRSRWLAVNLLTAFLAAAIVSMFGETIEKVVALAALMPIVAGMGGNAGTQALTVSVRALAMRELSSANARRTIVKEGLVGLINGSIFATLVGIIAALWFQNMMLGGVIAMAMIINLFSAGVFGASIPIILDKLKLDPAIASAVFLTTITDCIGFFAFLGFATLFML